MLRNPSKISERETRTIIDLYDASIRHVDEAVGLLLAYLKQRQLKPVIIVTADHGDEFGEHGTFSHLTTYDKIIRVPLIINGPGIQPGILVKDQVSHLDIAPTIVDILNLGKAERFTGESLLPLIEGKRRGKEGVIIVLHNYPKEHGKQTTISYRTEEWKYIYSYSLDDCRKILRRELYRLREDPEESRNLLETETVRAQQLENIILDYMSQTEIERMTGEIKEEKENIKAKVKRLGLSKINERKR
jgi:arylsulfatase A-like enzyme